MAAPVRSPRCLMPSRYECSSASPSMRMLCLRPVHFSSEDVAFFCCRCSHQLYSVIAYTLDRLTGTLTKALHAALAVFTFDYAEAPIGKSMQAFPIAVWHGLASCQLLSMSCAMPTPVEHPFCTSVHHTPSCIYHSFLEITAWVWRNQHLCALRPRKPGTR